MLRWLFPFLLVAAFLVRHYRPEWLDEPDGPERFELTVVDAQTGEPLESIAVRPSLEDPDDFHPYGHELGEEQRYERSPVTLPEGDYFVRAAGYAWASVGGYSSPRRRELFPAGSLEVELRNLRPADVKLELDAEGWRHDLELDPPADGALVLDHLPAGAYRVLVRMDRPLDETVLGPADVTVAAGDRARVALALDDPPPHGAPLAGRLDVAPGWDVRPEVRVGARGVRGRTARLDGDAFDAGLVPPGRYAIDVEPFRMRFVVEVADPGREDVVLRVPPPADVAVRVVDADGAPIPNATIRWRCAGARSGSSQDRWSFRAPATAIEVTPGGPRLGGDPQTFRLEPGRNEIEVVGRRHPVLRVRFRLDGEPHPEPGGFSVWAHPVGHDHWPVIGLGLGHPAPMFVDHEVTGPGRYRIEFRDPDGFRPIAPRTLDLPVGVTEIVIDLERE